MKRGRYEVGLGSMEKMRDGSGGIVEGKEKVVLGMGREVFGEGEYGNGIDYFRGCLELGEYNEKRKGDGYYWGGEWKYGVEGYGEGGNEIGVYVEFGREKN